jgi:hypothetical protein
MVKYKAVISIYVLYYDLVCRRVSIDLVKVGSALVHLGRGRSVFRESAHPRVHVSACPPSCHITCSSHSLHYPRYCVVTRFPTYWTRKYFWKHLVSSSMRLASRTTYSSPKHQAGQLLNHLCSCRNQSTFFFLDYVILIRSQWIAYGHIWRRGCGILPREQRL